MAAGAFKAVTVTASSPAPPMTVISWPDTWAFTTSSVSSPWPRSIVATPFSRVGTVPVRSTSLVTRTLLSP